jgi:hypothetical protein
MTSYHSSVVKVLSIFDFEEFFNSLNRAGWILLPAFWPVKALLETKLPMSLFPTSVFVDRMAWISKAKKRIFTRFLLICRLLGEILISQCGQNYTQIRMAVKG